MSIFKSVVSTLSMLVMAGVTQAAVIDSFTEDFEGDLSKWTGKAGEVHHGVIVVDPFDATNHVLTFSGLNSAGDMFTNDFLSTTGTYTVSFDYLGLGSGSDLGGYFGISVGLPDSHYWVAGTGSYPTPIDLADSGVWQHYELTFASPIGTSVRLMIEDWSGSGGVAGDIFFDNFQFRDTSVSVPEPSSLALLGMGLLAVAGLRKKSQS